MRRTTSKIKGLQRQDSGATVSLTLRPTFALKIRVFGAAIDVRILVQIVHMTHQHHDHRRHRQRQQDPGEAEQLAPARIAKITATGCRPIRSPTSSGVSTMPSRA